MIVGSVHLVECIENMYWLRNMKYEGRYSRDQYPYQKDGKGAVESSVEFRNRIDELPSQQRMEELSRIIRDGDPIESNPWLCQAIFAGDAR